MTKRPSLSDSMRALREETKPNPEQIVSRRAAELEAETQKPASVQAAKAPAKASRPASTGERYAGMKKMLIPLEEATHRKVKARAAGEGKTLEKAMQDLCEAYGAGSI